MGYIELLWLIYVWLLGNIAEISIFLVNKICFNFLIYNCKSKLFLDIFNISNVIFLHFLHPSSSNIFYILFLFTNFFVLLANDVILLWLIVNYKTGFYVFLYSDWRRLCYKDLCLFVSEMFVYGGCSCYYTFFVDAKFCFYYRYF